MYVPAGPLWLWTLNAGETGQLFSQPTVIWDGERDIAITGEGACVARCTFQSWLIEHDESHQTFPIQCGRVAMLAPDGSWQCAYHLHERWSCPQCGGLLRDVIDEACSPECLAALEASDEGAGGWLAT